MSSIGKIVSAISDYIAERRFKRKIELAIKDAVSVARMIIPIDTGNLRYDSFKLERIDETTWRIYIDQEVAPYAPYVNEKWISPMWGGKQNPNEGFFEKVFELISNQLAASLNGQIVVENDNEQEK